MKSISTILCLLSVVLMSHAALPSAAQPGDWKQIATPDGEFSIFMPAEPRMFLDSELSFEGGIKLTNQRVYVVCGTGIAFIVEMYDASNPRRDVKALLDNRSLIEKFERDLSVNGFNGKQFRRNWKDLYSNVQYFTGRKRIYVIQVLARDETNVAIASFLSSLTLGGGIASNANAPRYSLSLFPATPVVDHVFTPEAVTRKAVPVWKLEPTYSAQGLKDNTKGTVLLQAVISPKGDVTETSILKPLGHGLDEKAIEAAKGTVFIPAEKDGHPVPQYIKLEYHFDTGG